MLLDLHRNRRSHGAAPTSRSFAPCMSSHLLRTTHRSSDPDLGSSSRTCSRSGCPSLQTETNTGAPPRYTCSRIDPASAYALLSNNPSRTTACCLTSWCRCNNAQALAEGARPLVHANSSLRNFAWVVMAEYMTNAQVPRGGTRKSVSRVHQRSLL